ncbi:hypothetical protein ASPZODRAFT_138216 [Penicilliopsis zonata CBS 506.65]|uniref:Uncharacterized protein n=1 Tax=Penicilliopsis zonata CBS 506.65 TaxID=1073090 RepID=A0A1L9SVF2_9EURO|nr:hypothetical protein ASPZODRAFT_138216 [Penicilliopsis zonata CBS 506.65]OJJ51094.1 hypothetical protein ASPZODRAFT_138216 [Penicilliopsis zonata CBS 506.65]
MHLSFSFSPSLPPVPPPSPSDPLTDITRKSSFSTSTERNNACAFPSWPNRPSLLSPEPSASSYLSDEDLFFDTPSNSFSMPPSSSSSSSSSDSAIDDHSFLHGENHRSLTTEEQIARLRALAQEEETQRARFLAQVQAHARAQQALKVAAALGHQQHMQPAHGPHQTVALSDKRKKRKPSFKKRK